MCMAVYNQSHISCHKDMISQWGCSCTRAGDGGTLESVIVVMAFEGVRGVGGGDPSIVRGTQVRG